VARESAVILAYESVRARESASQRGRALAFGLLANVTGRTMDAADLQRGTHGKPFFAGTPDFSISHCQGLVAAVVARHGDIGLDIEPVNRVAAGVLRKVCDAEELLLAERRGPMYVWVAKEAALKCLGLSALMAAQVRLVDDFAIVRGAVLHIQRPMLAAGFEAAVASSAKLLASDIEVRASILAD
jgi:phosphopantetheinyl transferase